MDEAMFSYAISIGEGTLLAYGTGDMKDVDDLVPDEYLDTHTIIIGPADGTGQ